jgi:predicted N-acetyltransferase YhbS
MTINHKDYTFLIEYQNEEKWRERFNALTQKTYRFDFEKWYQSGYWDEGCILYSLAEGDKVVANITVNAIRFTVLGVEKKLMQIGTVMTDPDYKKQGLSRALMEKVMLDWQDHCDMIYLFANDSVLDFYPKFGFIPVNEYQAVYQLKESKKGFAFRTMNMDDANDRDLLFHTAQKAVPLFKISMKDNAGLVMFYAHYFDRFSVSDFLYYIADLKAVVVAEYEAETLILHDILAPATVDIKAVIHTMAQGNTREVILRFIPENAEGYEISLHKEDNSTLFVQAGCSKLFEDHQLIFPLLSHT